MPLRPVLRHAALPLLALLLVGAPAASAQATRTSPSTVTGNVMKHVSGSFDVKVVPRAPFDAGSSSPVGVMALDKRYHGPLDATATGEMLAARTESTGAAAYVAIERVSGNLEGKAGTFDMAHVGTMTTDAQHLEVRIVPGSGTGALAGITGTLAIRIEGKAHYYDLTYTLDR